MEIETTLYWRENKEKMKENEKSKGNFLLTLEDWKWVSGMDVGWGLGILFDGKNEILLLLLFCSC